MFYQDDKGGIEMTTIEYKDNRGCSEEFRGRDAIEAMTQVTEWLCKMDRRDHLLPLGSATMDFTFDPPLGAGGAR